MTELEFESTCMASWPILSISSFLSNHPLVRAYRPRCFQAYNFGCFQGQGMEYFLNESQHLPTRKDGCTNDYDKKVPLKLQGNIQIQLKQTMKLVCKVKYEVMFLPGNVRALLRTTFQKKDKYLEIDLPLFKIMCLEAPWYPPTIQRSRLTISLKNVSICTLGLNRNYQNVLKMIFYHLVQISLASAEERENARKLPTLSPHWARTASQLFCGFHGNGSTKIRLPALG